MRLTIIFLLAIFSLVQPLAMAQQAGENINVLPVVFPQDDPDWQLKGDGYLQRQVEPSIAASTRNPDHLIAFFNDYRAVDIADDVGLGETETIALLMNNARMLYASAVWLPLPEIQVTPLAAAEAWVGMSRSYDGGLTWSGAFLPGAPFDLSTESQASPVFGLEAATDPVVAPGPCGKFYVVFMAFTRGDESKLVVARYQDLNNNEGGDSIVYQGMTVVESGNNATHGYFLDKPDIEVDIFRDANPDICADRVYVSYSTFNGLDKDGKFQSKVSFASSLDSGVTFSTQKLNPPFSQNQGSALAVDPTDGTIYMIWRHFWEPDAILMVESANFGKKWSKPVVVTGDIVPMAPFDQPTISTTVAPLQIASDVNPGFPETAFRSNGFPTAAVTNDGTVFAAWQERVDILSDQGSFDFGRPVTGGSPRIVVMRSEKGSSTWTDVEGNPGQRLAVDIADRDTGDLPTPGFGVLPEPRPSGPQIMPKLSFSGGRLMLIYYESRGRIANYGTDQEELVSEADVSPYTTFISGYDRVIDLRAALLDPLEGDLLNEGSTTQVSRYPIRAGANLGDGEDLTDVAAVNSPCAPDSGLADLNGNPYPPCIRQVNRANAPQSAAGTSPFIGDYVDLAPTAQFTFDGGAWRWATEPTDVPYLGFHSIFTDNRHLIPPPGPNEWDGYQFYTTPFDAQCENAGSRNTDVLTSKVDAGLVLSAPTSYKQLDNQRGFPISVSNQTGEAQTYLVEIAEGFDGASFVRNNPAIDSGEIRLFAHSGTALMVYVETSATPPIKIRVSQLTSCTSDCPVGTITLNLDPENPPVAALDGFEDAQYPEITDPFVINPFVINDGVENPFVINPFVINPFVINPFVINPFVINPFVINPFVINPFVINSSFGEITAVTDTTWTVNGGDSNTASSYLPLINIDNAQAFLDAGYAFQLIVYKGSLYGGLDGCGAVNVAQPQILANVIQDPQDQVDNPFVINPFVINPFVINPFVINPFVINSTFTMAPSDEWTPDGTTEAPPASNEVKVTLRAFKLGGTLKDGTTDPLVYDPTVDPPSLVVVPLPCDPDNPVNCDVASNAPDLVSQGFAPSPIPVIADADRTLAGSQTGGWTLLNQGFGDATAENDILRHGYYICDTAFVDSYDDPILGRTEPLPVSDPLCEPITEFQSKDPINFLAEGDSASFDGLDLTIPDIAPGDYYLVLYVDDTLEVSESNEVNNWVAVPITIEEPNEPPVATDLSFTTNEDEALSRPLGVTDPNNDALTYTLAVAPTSGAVEIGDNAFTYTPDENFNGSDGFGFEVSDGEFSVGASVTITVTPINDPPVVTVGQVVVNEDATAQVIVTATDVDGDTLSYDITTAPTKGSVSPTNSGTGVFTYTPDPDLNGTDTFSVTVGDTTVEVTVTVDVSITAVADAPVADNATNSTIEDTAVGGTLTATDADGDALTYSLVTDAANGTAVVNAGGSYTYIPGADFNGADSFTFKANDGGLDSNTATISITVTPDNDAPVASDASFTTDENVPLSTFLPATDVDQGDILNFSITGPPSSGAVLIDDPATGAFTYTPGAWFAGVDTFTFTVTDTSDATATGVITITVIDPVPNWDFIGFANPWRPNYKVNAGSAIPLKWYYTDPVSGDIVDSSTLPEPEPQLEIRITGYPNCDAAGTPITIIEDPGSSDLRYVDGDWQFNWDTVGLPVGCYELSVYHPVTNQLDRYSDGGAELNIELK